MKNETMTQPQQTKKQGKQVDYQTYIAKFVYNYTLYKEGINVKNPTLSHTTIRRKARAIAIYIAFDYYNIPLQKIAEALDMRTEKVIMALRKITQEVQGYNWLANKIDDYITVIQCKLPTTSGITVHRYELL